MSTVSFIFGKGQLDGKAQLLDGKDQLVEVYTYNDSTGSVSFAEHNMSFEQVLDYNRYEMNLLRSDHGQAAYAKVMAVKFKL